MKITVYSLTWDARNACERIGTQLFASAEERAATIVDWVGSWGIEIESADELESDRVQNELGSRDVEYVLGEHTLEVAA